jgi:hypothetical protein
MGDCAGGPWRCLTVANGRKVRGTGRKVVTCFGVTIRIPSAGRTCSTSLAEGCRLSRCKKGPGHHHADVVLPSDRVWTGCSEQTDFARLEPCGRSQQRTHQYLMRRVEETEHGASYEYHTHGKLNFSEFCVGVAGAWHSIRSTRHTSSKRIL